MTTELAQKLEGVRDFKKILETVVKELGETYSADVSQIVLSNPLDRNLTSVCEYKLYPEAEAEKMAVNRSFALPLQGIGLGTISLARQTDFHENEVNWIRITLAELCDIIRHAQINDVVQRDTFRGTFLYEIQNVMQYSLGLGDALFMVVNILGKVLNVSRCMFICVDDTQAGFKCFEFWQRDRGISSAQDFGWPTTDSPIVARSLLARAPLELVEAQPNSYMSPVQQELQLLGVRSLLGVPLKSESATHGCVILQHCESRHQWTRGEIDMVQSVADTVAEALAKLPQEKLNAESKLLSDPLLRLHQREVVDTTGGEGRQSILSIRRNMKKTMGVEAIPTASKTTAPKPPVPNVQPTPQPTTPTPEPQPAMPPTPQPTMPVMETPTQANLATTQPTPTAQTPSEDVMATMSQLANSLMSQATDPAEVAKEMQKLAARMPTPDAQAAPPPAEAAPPATSPWGNLDAIPTPTAEAPVAPVQGAPPSTPPATGGGSPWGDLDSIPSPGGGNGTAGGASTAGGAASSWGDLDSIPTPAGSTAAGGLKGSMFGRRNSGSGASPLMASLHRDKSRFQQNVEFVDGGEIQIDEAQAQAKIAQAMQASSASNPTADYINQIAGVDPRTLMRIEGWVMQVEEKDKYASPHAIAVAEYSVAIARILGMAQQDVESIRLAAVLHDIGKMGLPANILQKPEDQLEDTELIWKMKHPIDGSNLIETYPDLAHLAPIVLAHHEEYDGNGYPAGLGGEQIPVAARIIHVASDYHSLISPKRSGEPGMPQAQAQQQLRQSAGSAYDPGIVEALIACEAQGLVAASR